MARMAIALTPEFANWEAALLIAVARGYLEVEIITASPDGEPVTSMGGLKVVPDIAYASLDPAAFDALVIPGGLAWEKGAAPDFTDHVRSFHD
ncbi:putative intracellular protease/amidase [Pseudorhizobium tarimense]|uniref:Intracellular protease/amidase n=1 Tax=Pseudorhizobium tarimense TaxID=1079109 RepID=A0ABV2H0G8_9HYPH|nr:DJ-1/PfpI family protein [Pseudorhizobium tarimense]MCJ8517386.1 DJ-1/PfpI family protein [Pseudorhizobium tarimense]